MHALKLIQQYGIGVISGEEALTRDLQVSAARVAHTFLPGAGEYVIEKFAKAYCEPLQMLWHSRCDTERIAPSDLRRAAQRGNPSEIKAVHDRFDQARRMWRGDLLRQHRHFVTFFPHVALHSKASLNPKEHHDSSNTK